MTLDDTEALVLDAVLQLLELRGIPAGRTDAATIPGQPRRVPEGWSDITAILPALRDGRRGVFFAIECKRPVGPRAPKGGKSRKAQEAFQETVERAFGVYLVVNDVADLNRWLNDHLDPSYHRPADFDP